MTNALRPETHSVAAILLRSLFRAYTGHASINAWLLAPKAMKPLLKCNPQFLTLTEVIISLLSLQLTAKWPTYLLVQLPLCIFYLAPLHPYPSSKLPLSMTLDEVVTHWQDDGILLTKPMSSIQNERARKLIKSRHSSGQTPVPLIQHHMDPQLEREHNKTWTTADYPPCTIGWSFSLGSGKSILVHQASTGELRQFWQTQNDPIGEIRKRRPPLAMGSNFGLYIGQGAWVAFWKADIPHQARTAW